MLKAFPSKAAVPLAPLALAGMALRGLVTRGRAYAERRRQRHFLALLDDHALRDIGLTRGQAWFESQKPFWRR